METVWIWIPFEISTVSIKIAVNLAAVAFLFLAVVVIQVLKIDGLIVNNYQDIAIDIIVEVPIDTKVVLNEANYLQIPKGVIVEVLLEEIVAGTEVDDLELHGGVKSITILGLLRKEENFLVDVNNLLVAPYLTLYD